MKHIAGRKAGHAPLEGSSSSALQPGRRVLQLAGMPIERVSKVMAGATRMLDGESAPHPLQQDASVWTRYETLSSISPSSQPVCQLSTAMDLATKNDLQAVEMSSSRDFCTARSP